MQAMGHAISDPMFAPHLESRHLSGLPGAFPQSNHPHTTSPQNRKAVLRRAHIKAHTCFVSLNSKRESDKEKKGTSPEYNLTEADPCALTGPSLELDRSVWLPLPPWRQPRGKSQVSHSCHPILVAFAWELTKETINIPLGCLKSGVRED